MNNCWLLSWNVVTEDTKFGALRREIDRLNAQILSLIQKRGETVLRLAALKRSQGLDGYDPRREEEMLQNLAPEDTDPFGANEVREIFKAMFRASLDIQDRARRKSLRVRDRGLVPREGIRVGGVTIGGETPVLFVGPCAVETPEQMEAIARSVASLPAKTILRAGAFKPRTSPYRSRVCARRACESCARSRPVHGWPP